MDNAFSLDVMPAPEALKQYVSFFRVNEHPSKDPVSVLVCPNGMPGMLFQAKAGASHVDSIVSHSGHALEDVPLLFVYGQITEPNTMHFGEGPFVNIQVLFKPDAPRALFGIDAASIANGHVTPEQFGGNELAKYLLHATSTNERLTIITDFLMARAQQAPPSDPAVEKALVFVQEHIEDASVKNVLSHIHISERQFEKRFMTWVGISPQLYIRIVRFNKAMEMIDSGNYERLSDVAVALNFHDQSHFIRDIRIFSNITPRSISTKTVDFYHDQVGSSYIGQ